MQAQQPVTRFVRLISLCTARNPEVVNALSPAERGRIAVEALMLMSLGVLIFAQWSALLSAGEGSIKGYVGALVFTLLFLGFDYILGASLERQAAQGVAGVVPKLSLVARFGMSAVAATVLSTAWAVKEFAHEIDTRNRIEAATTNAPLRAEYEGKAAEQKQRLLPPLDEKIRAKNAERESLQAALTAHHATVRQHGDAAAAALAEANRQNYGVMGAAEGQGALYGYAMAQRKAADDAAKSAAKDMAAAQARVSAVDAEIRQFDASRAGAVQTLAAIEAGLTQEMERDSRYVTAGTNFLSRFRGLIRLMKDPRDGLSTMLMVLAIGAVFVMLELAYLFSKMASAGMTYGPRDILRERRDLEAWARAIHMQMQENKQHFDRARAANDAAGAPVPEGQRGIRVVELKPRRNPQAD